MTTEYIDIVVRERGGDEAADSIDRVGKSAKNAQSPLSGFKRLLAAVGAIQAARAVNRLVSEYARLDRSLSQFATSQRSSTQLLRAMQRQANATGSDLDSTAEGYSRLSIATKDLGFSHERIVGVLDQIQKLTQLGGANAQEAAGGMRQLTQGLSRGKIVGDEFIALMENMPVLMRVIADSLGIPIGKLKQLSTEGKLTTDVVINALEEMRDETDRKFTGLTRTPTQAFQKLRNNAVITFGEIAKGTGILTGVTKGMDLLADNIGVASAAMIGLAINMAIMSGGGTGAALIKTFRAIGFSAKFMWRAILGPIGLVIAGIGLVIALFKKYQDATITSGEKTVTLGQIWKGVTNSMGEGWSKFVNFSQNAYAGFMEKYGEISGKVLSFAKDMINKKIGILVGAYNAIKNQWSRLPGAMADISIRATNWVISQTESMINATISGINTLVAGAESVGKFFTPKKFEKDFGRVGSVSLGRVSNQWAGTASEVFEGMKGDFVDALNVDYLGEGAKGLKQWLVDIADTSYTTADATNSVTDLDPVKPEVLSSLEQLKKLVTDFDKVGEPFDLAESGVQQLNTQLESGILSADRYDQAMAKLEQAFIATGGTAQQFGIILQNNPLASQAELLIQQLDRLRQPLDDIATAEERLNSAYRDGLISGQEYIQMLQQLDQAYLQAGGGQGTFATGFIAQLATMRKGAQDLKKDVGTAFGTMFTDFASGAADAFGRAIVYGEDLGSALQNVAKQALSQLIGALIKMGLQLVINALLGKTLAASATAASTASAATLAGAWAAPAAFASLATLGTNAAPASAAILGTTALSEGLAAATSFFKNGGAFGSQGVEMFANGGVFNQPTAFQFSRGGAPSLGVLGEAGPEAILPLKRGADGRLGVTAANAGGGGAPTALNVSVENYAPGVSHEVQQLSSGEVRVIAREEAASVVREQAPKAVAADIANPNSRVSNALARNTQTQRKRN